ncbi:MAG: metallophosphoesterase [Candidatus Pacearchaeota archaeon]
MEQNTELKKELLKLCFEKKILLEPEIFNILCNLNLEDAKKIIELISCLNEKLITKTILEKNVELIKNKISDQEIIKKIKLTLGLELEIKEKYKELENKEKISLENKKESFINKNVKILYSLINITKKIKPTDFVVHFRNRYLEIKKYLQERKELENLISINRINGKRQTISIIGIILEKRITKNKNIILVVEDLTGQINVLINHEKKEIYEKAKNALLDDIIAIKGFGNNEILFANEIYYPDIMLIEKNYLERDESIAFISDIHVGSSLFLENNFLKFINWINGKVGDEKQKEEANKVKYLFIVGDVVDGVGVYPGQEDLLSIKDIKEQYNKLAGYLKKIRKDITIIILPGQHDAVRVAEPQPPIGKDYANCLYELDNVILVSNPCMIEIKNNSKQGIKILSYHGASMSYFVNEIEDLRLSKAHDNPARVVKELLKRRHLAPSHSSVIYIPNEKYDPLIIREIPDVIVTGDFHKADHDYYNNIQIICCSCWQSITPFEEKVGNHPDPCKVPLLNLKTRKLKILDFSE